MAYWVVPDKTFPRGLRHRFGFAGDTIFETPPTEFTRELLHGDPDET